MCDLSSLSMEGAKRSLVQQHVQQIQLDYCAQTGETKCSPNAGYLKRAFKDSQTMDAPIKVENHTFYVKA